MIKVLAGAGIVVLLLAVLVLLLPFIIDLNSYQDRYLPLIEDALNRKVTLKNIRLTIVPRIGARVAGLAVQDDPAFGVGPFASLGALDVGVKLMPLLSGRVEVDAIELRNPTIMVIKNPGGALNVTTIGKKGPAEPKAVTRLPTHPPEGPLRILGLLAVDRVSLTGGTLTYRDLSAAEPTEYVLRDVTLQLASVGLGRTPTVHLSTLVQPLNLPITIDGAFGPLKDTTDIEAAVGDLALGNTLFSLKGSSVGGRTKIDVSSPAINSADLPVPLPLKNPVVVKDLRIAADLQGRDAHLSLLSFELFNGRVKSEGGLTFGTEAPPFHGNVSVQGLHLGPLLAAIGTDKVSVSGMLAMNLALQGRGFSTADLTRALEGTGHVAITDGKLEGINLRREVATLLKVVGIAPADVRATAFSTIEGDIGITQGLVHVRRLLVDSHDVQAAADGTVGFDQTLNLKADLHLSEALSLQIAGASPVAKLAMADGRLTVPLVITGTVQAPSYGLDTKAVGAKVREQAREKVKETVREMLKSESPEEAIRKGRDALRQLLGR